MDSVYEWEMTRLCTELKEQGIPLEINILGKGEGARHYPAERFWKIAGETGNQVILGLDAHSVRQMRDVESWGACMELVKKYNLDLLNGLDIK
jgi:histidinol-phosphatase (PHP family)